MGFHKLILDLTNQTIKHFGPYLKNKVFCHTRFAVQIARNFI